ncbi:sulfotransferase family protein [Hyphomonas sp.]|uniref:sulfotransferase family protein n=1 Tax=Hyphomonas sp. TaxID=87 RepID=UPI0035698ACC
MTATDEMRANSKRLSGKMPAKLEAVTAPKTAKALRTVSDRSEAARRPIIVVLGMHRSGTSVLTRALAALGVELGSHMMLAVEQDNDKGFWEDLDIYRLNERLLKKCNSAWHRLASLEVGRLETEEFAAERVEAANLISTKIQDVDLFAFKDPRTAVLLPFWQCVLSDLELEPQYVIAVRNPLEISESLRKRDGFDQTKNLLLWLTHMYSAVQLTDGAQRVFVGYQQVIADPLGQLSRICEALGLTAPSLESAAYKEYADEFLDGSLNHNRISPNELARCESIPDVFPAFYQLLNEWADADDGKLFELPADLNTAIERYLSDSQHLFAYSDRLEMQVAALAERVEELGVLKRKLSDKDAMLFECTQREQALTEEVVALLSKVDGLGAEVTMLSAQKAAYAAKTMQSDLAVAAHEQTAMELRTELRLQRASLLELRNSSSWRLTRPIRAIKHLLNRLRAAAKRRV